MIQKIEKAKAVATLCHQTKNINFKIMSTPHIGKFPKKLFHRKPTLDRPRPPSFVRSAIIFDH